MCMGFTVSTAPSQVSSLFLKNFILYGVSKSRTRFSDSTTTTVSEHGYQGRREVVDRLGFGTGTHTRHVSDSKRRWVRRHVSPPLRDNQHLSSAAAAWCCLGLVKCGHAISCHIYPENRTRRKLRVYFKQISRKGKMEIPHV